jgi:raffinose/stachyose/melibiose transport system substrate-binding protein
MKKSSFLRMAALCLTILMLATLMVACNTTTTTTTAPTTAAPAKIVVRILTQFGENTKHNGIKLLGDEITKQNPQYVFEAEHLGYDSYVQKLKQQIAAGTPPSIFTGRAPEFPEFIKAGKVVELTNQPWVKDYNDEAFGESKTADGKVWTMPYDFGGLCIFYSKAMFTKYNLKAPTTKTEWMNVCETFQKAGVTPFAFGGSEADPDGYTMENWLFSQLKSTQSGLTALQKVMNNEISIKDVPEVRKALELNYEMFVPYIEKNDMGIPREKAYDMFMGQQRPMTLHGSFVVGVFRAADPKADIGVFPVCWSETAADNKIFGFLDDNMMAATDGVTDAALKFFSYASSVPGLNIWAKAASAFTSSKLIAQLPDLDPISKELMGFKDKGQFYFKAPLISWQGNYNPEWQALCQEFFAAGIDAHAKGTPAATFVTSQLELMDKRIKALK